LFDVEDGCLAEIVAMSEQKLPSSVAPLRRVSQARDTAHLWWLIVALFIVPLYWRF